MSSTTTQTLSIVCDNSIKTSDNQYKLSIGNLASRSVQSITLKSCNFKNIFYNVISSNSKLKNNTFHSHLDGVEENFDIPEGFYNINELLDAVSVGISSFFLTQPIPPTLVDLSYNSITGKVSIEVDDNGSAVIYEIRGLDKPNSINFLLGNTVNLALNSVSGSQTPSVFDSIVNLSGQQCVNLVCEQISKNSGAYASSSQLNGNLNNSIRNIPVNAAFGNTIQYASFDTDADSLNYSPSINLSDLVFSIVDTATNTILDMSATTVCLELILYFS
jgi:hypothetical protein|tara:strand:- start:21 stop:845 length:825 start_codon:yes stop_codon:yes gene_type:complete